MLPSRRDALLLRLIASAILFALSYFLAMAFRGFPSFTQNVYLPFSRIVSGWLGMLFSFSAYAVMDALDVLAVAGILFLLVRSVVRSVRERTAWPLALWGSGIILFAAVAGFLFMLLWGGTYYAPKVETRLGLKTGPQEEAILYRTAMKHLEDAVRYAALVPRDADGKADAGGFDALAPEAVRAVKSLMEKEPGIFGKALVLPPKRTLFDPFFGMFGIAGVYIPFTGEAIVSTINTDPFLPSVMAHELAHRLGFAPEDDANFIAYLACMESKEPVLRYSGSLMAFNYCYGALTNQEYRRAVWNRLGEEGAEVLGDFERNREAWRKYERPVLREMATAVNNSYLQSMGQQEGVKSYGLVVDLLIALYISDLK